MIKYLFICLSNMAALLTSLLEAGRLSPYRGCANAANSSDNIPTGASLHGLFASSATWQAVGVIGAFGARGSRPPGS